MIRKTVIVVLTLAALMTATLHVASFVWRPTFPYLPTGEDLDAQVLHMRHLLLYEESVLPGCAEMDITDSGSYLYQRGIFKSLELTQRETFGIRCCRGRFAIACVGSQQPFEVSSFAVPLGEWTTTWAWQVRHKGPFRIIGVRGALWLPLLLFAGYPTLAFIYGRVRRWRRRRRGCCLKCGYDLTGNVSGVCPECGKRIGS